MFKVKNAEKQMWYKVTKEEQMERKGKTDAFARLYSQI